MDNFGKNYCSGNSYQVCGNYDSDGCLEWGQTTSCPQYHACQGAGECYALSASLSASYSNLRKNEGSPPPGFGGGNWWYYDVKLKEESGNVGITVQKRQRCYTSNNPSFPSWCDPEKTDIATLFGTNHISAGGQITGNNPWVWFNRDGYTYTVTETFWGIDDNSNNKQTSYSFTVTSS